MKIVRESAASDNDCLFTSIIYLLSSSDNSGPKQSSLTATNLRQVCAQTVSQVNNFFGEVSNEVVLGQTVQEYQKWIMDPFHWGGENEILILARHFNVEIKVVSCESLTVLSYNSEIQEKKLIGKLYLLYTGQHYDPIVGINQGGEKILLFPENYAAQETVEREALVIAADVQKERKKAMEGQHAKKLKCLGKSLIKLIVIIFSVRFRLWGYRC